MPITQTITVLPTPPSRADPENFDSRADAFLSALPTMQSQMNTWAGQANQTAQEVGIVQEGLLSLTPGADKVPLADETGKIANGWLDLSGYEPADATILKSAAIGSTIQGYDADLSAIAGLEHTDGNIIVGNGSTWVAESGATARTSLGLGTANNVEFLTVDPTNGVRVTNENTTEGVGNAPLCHYFSNSSGRKTFHINALATANSGIKVHFPNNDIFLCGTIHIIGHYEGGNNKIGYMTYTFSHNANGASKFGSEYALNIDLINTSTYWSMHSITDSSNDHIFEFRRSAAETGSDRLTIVFDVFSPWEAISQISTSWFETFTYS